MDYFIWVSDSQEVSKKSENCLGFGAIQILMVWISDSHLQNKNSIDIWQLWTLIIKNIEIYENISRGIGIPNKNNNFQSNTPQNIG